MKPDLKEIPAKSALRNRTSFAMCFFLKSAKSAGEQSCIPALSAAVNWILSETQLTRTGDYFFCFLGKNAKCKMQKKNQVTKKKVSIV